MKSEIDDLLCIITLVYYSLSTVSEGGITMVISTCYFLKHTHFYLRSLVPVLRWAVCI